MTGQHRRLFSWNVNGIRAIGRKGFVEWLLAEQPDVLAVQETKAMASQVPVEVREPAGYHTYWASAERKGYSGVALFSRTEPRRIHYGIGIDEYDREGRTLTAEYDDFVLVNAYFPNGSRDHSRVPFKMAYKAAFLAYCEALRAAGKRVFFCGDVNTSHRPIDLARPGPNSKHTGFLPEERVWIDQIVELGYVDTFRHRHPDRPGAYTWWSYIGGARGRNVGWRLDYFFAAPEAHPLVIDAAIHPDVMGSDHCPVSITVEGRMNGER